MIRSPHTIGRRTFLQQTTTGAALLSLPHVLAQGAAEPRNERINIGIIGSGDRGSALLRELLPLASKHNIAVTAVCDVWTKNRAAAAALVQKSSGAEPKQFSNFADLLGSPVQAVIIATPDFSHGPLLVAALEAKKDVYVEKPMAIDLPSANRALDLCRAQQNVVQAGTQRRSDGLHRGAAAFIRTGALGSISRISAAMNVNAPRWARRSDDCLEADVDWNAFWLGHPKTDFNARLLRCWQLFRATTNGFPGLWMTHYADAVHLLTGAQYPSRAVALGGTYIWKDGREHPDTFHTVLEYPEGFLFDWGMGLGNSSGIHFSIHGTKGTFDVESWSFSPEPSGAKPAPAPVKIQPASGSGHMENWVRCLRSRERPNADIQFGHQHAVATIMTATAAETGRRQFWKADTREIVPA